MSTCEIRLVQCSVSDRNCTISGLTLSLKNYTFKPVAPNPNSVIGFEIKKSTVPVITSEICVTFPKLKTFVAVQQGIQVIEDYAFSNCTEATLISIPFNNIHTLGKGIFDNMKQLQEINMHGGSLEQIDVNLLNDLGELIELVISANKLKELPAEAIKNLKKLKILYLYSNELTDLNADGLIESLPNLRAIYINDNNFQCDRLNEMISIFKAKSIMIVDHTHSVYLKKRDYIPHKVDDIICLTQVELEFEKMKNALNKSLDELKEYPIGKAVIQLKDIVHSGFEDADSNIVVLSKSLNETSSNFTQQILNINQTLNVATKKIQEIADSMGSMVEYISLSSNLKSNKNANIAIWILLISLFLIIVTLSVFVYKKFRNIHADTPTLCYKNGSVQLEDEQHLCS